ncbi:hypothetical protein BS50DRAFT_10884 [Corynespora cassiicola Philippines]|uniref:Uncharacterized protein n=1 Tax=Corynespora cassiicola Philippines TaxID=1448308 RepID=A0A2T2P987_CORCC|nr:hypothetical protein BS50DRAFT_10884 [Corynespora cassiicola Philippines]
MLHHRHGQNRVTISVVRFQWLTMPMLTTRRARIANNTPTSTAGFEVPIYFKPCTWRSRLLEAQRRRPATVEPLACSMWTTQVKTAVILSKYLLCKSVDNASSQVDHLLYVGPTRHVAASNIAHAVVLSAKSVSKSVIMQNGPITSPFHHHQPHHPKPHTPSLPIQRD